MTSRAPRRHLSPTTSAPARPPLRLVAPPRPRPRPQAPTRPQRVAALTAGVAAGSLLAALASLPFGMAATSMRVALGAAVVCGVALARARMQRTRNAARAASVRRARTASATAAPHRSPGARRDERSRLRAAA